MKACDDFAPDLAAYLYGDLAAGETRALEAHLGACDACRETLRGLQRTALSLDHAALFSRESEVDWEALASATVQRARGFRPGRRRKAGAGPLAWLDQVRRAPGWAAAAAGLLLLVGGALGTYGALRFRPAAEAPLDMGAAAFPQAVEPARLPPSMLDDIEAYSAMTQTKRYLAESRSLLVSLLGSPIKCEKGNVDISDERSKSLQLIRRQQLLADELQQLPLARARSVCRDLEQLLLEIASLNDCARAEQILELRRLVEKRQLLLRIDLLSDELARRAATDA